MARGIKTVIFVGSLIWLIGCATLGVIVSIDHYQAADAEPPEAMAMLVIVAVLVLAMLIGAAIARASRPWVKGAKSRSFRLS